MYNILICSLLLSRGIGEPKYMPIHTWEALNKILTDALRNYNELNAAMDLVS
jgi:dynein heavy chain